MSISAATSTVSPVPYQPIQPASRGRVDNGGDEATESAAAKTKEASKASAKPVDANRGTLVNVTA